MMLRPPVSTTADTLFPYPPLFRSVAQVAQPPERDEQPVIVALVQTDRRLVQHIKHARQARPDLAREPDALAFAARQRARRAIQVEIIQADIVEEAEPLDDLLQYALGDRFLLVVQMIGQIAEESERWADRSEEHTSELQSLMRNSDDGF